MNIDRNQLTGLIIITIMLMGYNYFFAQKPLSTILENAKTTTESIINPLAPAATAVAKTHTKVEHCVPAEIFVLENETLRVEFRNDGGSIIKVVLKKYADVTDLPLVLLDVESSSMNYTLTFENGDVIRTKDMQFRRQEDLDGENSLRLIADLGRGITMTSKFFLEKNSYNLKHEWFLEKDGEEIACKQISFEWDSAIRPLEKDITACRNKTTINYFSSTNKFDHLKETSSNKEEYSFQEPMKWISIKQRFFSTAVIAKDSFISGTVSITPSALNESDKVLKYASTILTLGSNTSHHNLSFYFGPNDYSTLKKVTEGFYRNVPLGWSLVRWINFLIIIPIFKFLTNHITNYGIIILLLVLFIKLLLLPLSYKAYISTAKMKLIKPALDEIKERLGNDLQKIQMEHLKLYKEFGVNPLGGLGLILLQMPILFAMFYFIPNMIQFRGKTLLWASDASTYDSVLNLPFNIPLYGNHVSLFTLLMTISTILHTLASSDIKSQQGPIKMMAYTMPITFMLVLNNFSAALSFYYFLSNLATLGIQFVIKKFVNEEQIKKQLEENRTKIKSKPQSTFRARIEAMMNEARKRKK